MVDDIIIEVLRKNNCFGNKIKKLYIVLKLNFEKFQFSLLKNNFLELLLEIKNLTKKKMNGFLKESFINIELRFDKKKEKLLISPSFEVIKNNFGNFLKSLIENIFKSVKFNMFKISKEYLSTDINFLEFIREISDCIKSSNRIFYDNLLNKKSDLKKIKDEIFLNLKNNYERIKINTEKLTRLELFKKIKNFREEIKKKFIYKEFIQILTDIKNMKKKLENTDNKKGDGIFLFSIKKIRENLLEVLNQGLFQFKFFVPDFVLKKTQDFYSNLLESSKLINKETNNFDQFFDFYKNFKKLEYFLDNINFNFTIISDYNKIFYIPNFKIKKPDQFSNLINRVSFLKNRISFEYMKKKKEIDMKKNTYLQDLKSSIEHFFFSYSYKKKLLLQYCQEFIILDYLNDFLNNFNLKFEELIEIKEKIESYNKFFIVFKEKKIFTFDYDIEKLNCIKKFFDDIKIFKSKLNHIDKTKLKDFEKKEFEEFLISFKKKINHYPFKNTKIIEELKKIIKFQNFTFNLIKKSKKKRKKSLKKWGSESSSKENLVLEKISKKSSMKIQDFKEFLKKFY